MRVVVEGKARLRRLGSTAVVMLEPDDLDWHCSDGGERQMGRETIHRAHWTHDEGGSVTWTLTEYPQGAENFRDTQSDRIEVLADFNYRLEHEPE